MLCQTHPRVLGPRFHCHQARVRHIFLFFVFCPFFESAFSLLTKSGWSDCPVPRSLCLLSKWQLNSLDKRSQEGTGLRQSLSRQVISTTTPIPASPVSRNRMTMPFEVILDAVFWDVKFWRRAGNVSEEGRCSSKAEQTLFVRTECSLCQEASHQQTEVAHNNPILASLDNPSRGWMIPFLDSCMIWGLKEVETDQIYWHI